jgi:hypothetical protein
MFGNRVLMIIFEPKRKGVTGSWRKFRDDKLHK